MIPRLLLAAVAAYLALEGYSLLTAPPSLIKVALAKVNGEQTSPAELDIG